MIKRTIDISEPAYLHLKNQQLLIERDSEVIGSVPVEDLGVLILEHPAIVITQAAIFGFRHSNDFSERSITVGLIGLVMGIGYVTFGRNLWPLIIAHCVLNTMSMIGRV